MIPRPTSWPRQFPPQGGYLEVRAIADYLNEPIDAARVQYNRRLAEQGKALLTTESDFERVYLPRYPSDGWRNLGGGIPPYQVIGPLGIGGFGLHEFMGHPEIIARVNEMQNLALGANNPPVYPPPQPPTVPPPAPAPQPPSGQLPPGTPPPLPVPAGNPYVVTFANGAVAELIVNDSRVPISRAQAMILTRDTIAFFYNDPENLEVFLKILDGRGVNGCLWVFASGLTDVGATLRVGYQGQERMYPPEGGKQGVPFPTVQDTSAFRV